MKNIGAFRTFRKSCKVSFAISFAFLSIFAREGEAGGQPAVFSKRNAKLEVFANLGGVEIETVAFGKNGFDENTVYGTEWFNGKIYGINLK